MAMNPVKRYWTVAEYLAHEEASHIKHEYLDGEIYAMTGGTDNHSLIKANIVAEIRQQLRQSSTCRVYDSDMRVKITDSKYVYPDMTVVCGESSFADTQRSMLLNPTFVVEVMSASSANFDRGAKANFYRSLPSVKIYLLLEQNRAYAQVYSRHEAGWLLREFSGLEAFVPLEVINCRLSLSEAYLNVHFDEEPLGEEDS